MGFNIELKDLRELVVPNSNCSDDLRGLPRIVVLQRSWVVVGKYFQIGNQCRVESAFVIRRWGTTAGLGELAEKGPLPETKLDAAGTVKFHEFGIICTFDCNVGKWGEICK